MSDGEVTLMSDGEVTHMSDGEVTHMSDGEVEAKCVVQRLLCKAKVSAPFESNRRHEQMGRCEGGVHSKAATKHLLIVMIKFKLFKTKTKLMLKFRRQDQDMSTDNAQTGFKKEAGAMK
jgi:hypothetical protein